MPRVVLMCGQEQRASFDVPEGTSLQEVMLRRNPETGNWPAPTICIYAGQPVLREQWAQLRLLQEDIVVFAELPMGGGGGGSNPLQAIVMVAVMVAAVAVPQSAFLAGTMLAAGTTGGSLLSAGIMLGGSLLSGMIFGSVPSGQLPAYQAEAASPTYALNGTSNQARLWQPVPEGFGTMRVVADVVANQWAQYIFNEMYIHQVFGCGRGTYERHALSFGDVEFWRDGHFIESAYTTESGEQYTNRINQQLVAVADGGGTYGPWPAVDVSANARTLNLTVSFPDGLSAYAYKGMDEETGDVLWFPASATASIMAECREIDDAGNPLSGWSALASRTVTESREDAFTVLVSGKAAHFGRYEVRITNTSVIPDESTHILGGPNIPITYRKANRKRIFMDNASSTSLSVQIQIVEPGGTVTLFPDNVDTSISVSSQELLAPNAEGHDWIGPFPANSPGTMTNQILYGFVMPGGLGQYDNKGRFQNYTVNLEIQYQAIDDNDNALSGWQVLRLPSYTAGTLTAQRKTETCIVAPGRYQTRVRRTSDRRTDNKAVETIQWEYMTAVIPGSLVYEQTVIAVKIKAGNVLSQNAANSFAVLQTRKLPLYDRQARVWSDPEPTRSVAAALSHVCKAGYGGALVDRQIDLDSLWRIDEELAAMNWHYDAWVDGAYTVWNLLVEMCNAVRMVPRPAGTVLSFVMDKAHRPVRHAFSPRDIVRNSLVLTWNTFEDGTPDDVVLSYLDESVNYLQREVRAKLPESESRNPSTQTILGICNRDHAHKLGVFKAACNRWRRTGCEFETEGMGRLLTLGDVVSVTHPRFRDTASGALAGWDAAALLLQLESPLEIEPGNDVYMSLTRPDGSPWGPVRLLWADTDLVLFDPEDYAALIMQGFESPFPWLTVGGDRMPTVWTLQQSREYSRRFIVTGIHPHTVYRYRISCINDSDMVDSYDIPTPPWEYRSNLSEPGTLPAPDNVQVTRRQTDTGFILAATWGEVSGATGYEIETGADGITWVRYGRVNAASVEMPVADGTSWFRVATVRGFEQSSWVTWH